MKLWLCTVVWGEEYVNNYLNYALPSFLAAGNLPALLNHVEAEYLIFTHDADLPRFQASPMFARLAKLVDIKLCTFTPGDRPPRDIEYFVKKPVVDTMLANKEALMFLAPDMIWANGSLGHAGKSLAAGKLATFLPNFKVTTETLTRDVTFDADGLLDISLPTARMLVCKHMHPICGSAYIAGPRAPPHHDYLIWPIGNEGVIFYYLVRGPDCYIPAAIDFTAFWSVGPRHVNADLFETAQPDQVLGLSLTPLAHMMNFLHAGKPHNILDHAQFMHRHPASMVGLLYPVMLPLVEKMNPGLWSLAMSKANGYFNGLMQIRNAIGTGEIPSAPPPYLPASYATQLTADDIVVSREVLSWLKPVIADRFPQASLELLESLSAK